MVTRPLGPAVHKSLGPAVQRSKSIPGRLLGAV